MTIDVQGCIIAFSHVIRLKSPGNSFIIKFMTEDGCVDVIVKDEDNFNWLDEIMNGDFYELNKLKKCSVKMGKSEISMLLTTKESNLKKIDSKTSYDAKENYIVEDKSLISFKGSISKVIDSEFCTYELDNNLILCTLYLKSSAYIPTLDEGDVVSIERCHLLPNASLSKDNSLLCCGLSNIKLMNAEIAKEDNTISTMLSNLVCCLGIGYKSLSTFKNILMTLKNKLCPTFLSYKQLITCEKYQNSLSFANGFLAVLLNCSHLIEKSYLTTEFTHSTLNEFVGCPHVCLAMRNICLPKDLDFPTMDTLLSETKKAVFTSYKTWKCSLLINTIKDKKILVGCLTCTDDGSLYLHDQSSAISVTIIKSLDNGAQDSNATLCPVVHNYQNFNINRLVAVSSFEFVTEKSAVCETNSHSYLLVKDCDIFVLSEKEAQTKSTSKPEENQDEMSLRLCQVIVPRKKSLPILGDEEWRNQFFIEAITISNVVVEVDCKDSAPKNQSMLNVDESFDDDRQVASSLPNPSDRRKKELVVGHELLKLYPLFATGQALMIKIPYKLQFSETLEEDTNLMIRRFINSNPLTLPKDTVIEPFERDRNICPLHSSYKSNQESKIKLIEGACFCSTMKKYHSVEEVSTQGEMFHPRDPIDIEGFLKEKWIVKNKEVRSDLDPPLQISLVLADKENPSVTLTLYITQSHPDWALYGLIPGKFIRLTNARVLKSQHGTYYLKSANRFGLELVESSSSTVDIFWKNSKPEPTTSPSPLKYFMHINDNQPFRSLSTIIRVLTVEIFNCGAPNISQVPPAKAKFILDDGSLQVTAHCSGVNVKHLLNISERQFQDLLSIASTEPGGLHYNWWNVRKKVDTETNSRVLLFRYLCSRNDIRRQVIAHCRAYSSSREAEHLHKGQFRVFCISIEKVQPIDVSVELLKMLRK